MTALQNREEDLAQRLLNGEVRALSRTLTLVENQTELGAALHRRLYANTGKAHIIGITGSPGAGKSSLVNEIALTLIKAGNKVAILAVDPSSPYSGGAVLGDRIRMDRAVETDAIYVRSMASRGALGGLSHTTTDAIDILDAAGFSHILVETVGVGQGEVDIARAAHTSIVVLVPGMGDEVQVMKAGILEIADIFVINKSDRPGVHALERELRILMTLVMTEEKDWKIPILKTIAIKAEGVEALVSAVTEHRVWLETSGIGAQQAVQYMSERILALCSRGAVELIKKKYGAEVSSGVVACLERKTDPHTIARKIVNKI